MAEVWGDVLSVLRDARGEVVLVRHTAVRGVLEWRCRENWRGTDVARPRLLIDASLKTILAVVRALEPVAACKLSPGMCMVGVAMTRLFVVMEVNLIAHQPYGIRRVHPLVGPTPGWATHWAEARRSRESTPRARPPSPKPIGSGDKPVA